MAYDMARAVTAAAKRRNVGPFIFELARSEMGYTEQTCDEFATVMMAAAIKEGFSGPIFIQGDHYQADAKKYGAAVDRIRKAIDAQTAAQSKLKANDLESAPAAASRDGSSTPSDTTLRTFVRARVFPVPRYRSVPSGPIAEIVPVDAITAYDVPRPATLTLTVVGSAGRLAADAGRATVNTLATTISTTEPSLT
jgi:hypothetical protein